MASACVAQRQLVKSKLQENKTMRMSVNLDDNLIAEAKKLTKIEKTASLIRYAIKNFASYEAAKYLSTLGGSEPGLRLTPRRRMETREEDRE